MTSIPSCVSIFHLSYQFFINTSFNLSQLLQPLIFFFLCCYYRYLREEFIECQIWLKVLNKKDNVVTNKSRDRLLGSAYIDASGIAKSSSLKGSVRYGFEHLFFGEAILTIKL